MPFSQPDQIIKRLNADLLDDYSTVSMFSTAFIGTFDPLTRKLLFSNAGQSPILFMPAQGEPRLLEAQDIPIGIFDGYEYTSQELTLAPGDVLVAATDGFNESRNDEGEMFGISRMALALKHLQNLNAKEIAKGLFKAVNGFSENHLQDDDRTIIVLKVSEKMESVSFQIPAGYEELRIAAKALRDLLMLHKVEAGIIDNCELALQELLTNIVEHSYNGNKDKMINIRLRVEGKQFIVETMDTGVFANITLDPVRMPDPLELQVGGYGMAIIQALMDEVQYQYNDSKNMWKLIKKI
jgi:anti-sigma regulatory factor (Ser/Thr protein kinase)